MGGECEGVECGVSYGIDPNVYRSGWEHELC